jgi:hypothetical protein
MGEFGLRKEKLDHVWTGWNLLRRFGTGLVWLLLFQCFRRGSDRLERVEICCDKLVCSVCLFCPYATDIKHIGRGWNMLWHVGTCLVWLSLAEVTIWRMRCFPCTYCQHRACNICHKHSWRQLRCRRRSLASAPVFFIFVYFQLLLFILKHVSYVASPFCACASVQIFCV